MPTFDGREAHGDFVAWIGRHRTDGYIPNYHLPTPKPDYLYLHKGLCRDLWGSINEGKSMTTKYGKRSSTDRRELEEWVRRGVRGATIHDIHECEHCFQ